jgi:hypothetical protein
MSINSTAKKLNEIRAAMVLAEIYQSELANTLSRDPLYQDFVTRQKQLTELRADEKKAKGELSQLMVDHCVSSGERSIDGIGTISVKEILKITDRPAAKAWAIDQRAFGCLEIIPETLVVAAKAIHGDTLPEFLASEWTYSTRINSTIKLEPDNEEIK